MAGALPNLVIIGAPKCGTTALHYYLDLHPEVSMSRPKELNFFAGELDSRGMRAESVAVVEGVPRTWSRGPDWYASHFSGSDKVRGDASPAYFAPWFPEVPERMAALIPGAQLLLCARDPVERAISHYAMHTARGNLERRPVEEALADQSSPYVAFGRYWSLLQPFLDRFPRSQVMVVDQEELRLRRRETVSAVFRFAGVDDSFWSPRMERELNRTAPIGRRHRLLFRLRQMPGLRWTSRLPGDLKWAVERAADAGHSGSRPALDPGLRAELEDGYREEAERLRAFSGQSFAGWSV